VLIDGNMAKGLNTQHDYTHAYVYGSGALLRNCQASLVGCTISNNIAVSEATGAWVSVSASGGGLAIVNGTCELDNCQVQDNTVAPSFLGGWGTGSGAKGSGGGISVAGNANCTIIDSTVSGNGIQLQSGQTWYGEGQSYAWGGGICVGIPDGEAWLNGQPYMQAIGCTLTSNTIHTNTARGAIAKGGCLATCGSAPWTGMIIQITNCHIQSNEITNDGGEFDLSFGGGVAIAMGPMTVENCRVTDNMTTHGGGAFYAEGEAPSPFRYSTICGNSQSQIVGNWTDEEANQIEDDCQHACPGDITGDSDVGPTDLLIVLSEWGEAGGIGDVTDNGLVNTEDVLLVIGSWGPCP
jgi:hypothetical protein